MIATGMQSRTIRSCRIGHGRLGPGFCYVHGDENNACLTEIEAGLCNPASLSVKCTLFSSPRT